MYFCGMNVTIFASTSLLTVSSSIIISQNLVRTAISSITYLRNIFPEECYIDKKLTGLNIRTLIPNTPESKLLLNWLEQGVFDALEKHYLEDIVLAIYTRGPVNNTLLECYQFHMTYPDEILTGMSDDGPNMSLIHTTNGKDGQTSETHTYSREEIKDSTVRLIRTLISLAQTLKALPRDRFLTMKLQYRDDVTPIDYEPKFFRAADEDDELVFDQKPFKVAVGGVQTQFHEISMKMKSIADSFGENDETIQQRALSYNAPPQTPKISTLTPAQSDSVPKSIPKAKQSHNPPSASNQVNSNSISHHSPKMDYYQLKTRQGVKDTVSEITSKDAPLFNIFCEHVLETGDATKGSIMTHFDDLNIALTSTQVRVYLKEMAKRGLVSPIGRSAKYRVSGEIVSNDMNDEVKSDRYQHQDHHSDNSDTQEHDSSLHFHQVDPRRHDNVIYKRGSQDKRSAYSLEENNHRHGLQGETKKHNPVSQLSTTHFQLDDDDEDDEYDNNEHDIDRYRIKKQKTSVIDEPLNQY